MKSKIDVTIHKIYFYVNRHPLLFGTIHFVLWCFNQRYGCLNRDLGKSVRRDFVVSAGALCPSHWIMASPPV